MTSTDGRRCAACGLTIGRNTGRGRPRKWCVGCRAPVNSGAKANRTLRCQRCEGPMARTRGSFPQGQATCQSCRRVLADEMRAVSYGACGWCDKPLYLRKGDMARRKFCSIACGRRTPGDRKQKALTRSRERHLRHAETWDGITDAEIFDRDGWRCMVNGCQRRKIDPTKRFPHPQSPSIDHVIPLSHGGGDVAANKRAAHLRCNVARGNRGGGEQLMLLGSLRDAPLPPRVVGDLPRASRSDTAGWPQQRVVHIRYYECKYCGVLSYTRSARRTRTRCSSPACYRLYKRETQGQRVKRRAKGLKALALHEAGESWSAIAVKLGYGNGTGASKAARLAASSLGVEVRYANYYRTRAGRGSSAGSSGVVAQGLREAV